MKLQEKQKSTIKTILGVFLIAIGILGMIVPILPGWWVVLLGLQLLGLKLVIDRNKPWRKMISFKDHSIDDENPKKHH